MARTVGKDGLGFSGSIGHLTFRHTKHGVVVAAKSDSPKNRRTPAQQRGRLIMRHLTSFFTQLKPHLPLAFETKASNLTDTNAFVSANYHDRHPVFLSQIWRDMGALVLAPYRISDGTLPEIAVTEADGVYSTDIQVGHEPLSAYATVGALAAALLKRNADFRVGDEIIYIAGYQSVDVEGVPRVEFRHWGLVLDPCDKTPLDASLLGEGFCNQGGFLGRRADCEPSSDAFAWVHLAHSKHRTRVSPQRLILKSTALCDLLGTEEALMDAIKNNPIDLSGMHTADNKVCESSSEQRYGVNIPSSVGYIDYTSSCTVEGWGLFEISDSLNSDAACMESIGCDIDEVAMAGAGSLPEMEIEKAEGEAEETMDNSAQSDDIPMVVSNSVASVAMPRGCDGELRCENERLHELPPKDYAYGLKRCNALFARCFYENNLKYYGYEESKDYGYPQGAAR